MYTEKHLYSLPQGGDRTLEKFQVKAGQTELASQAITLAVEIVEATRSH